MINPRLRNAINDFCYREYGCEADFSKPTEVGVLYTEVSAEELSNEWEDVKLDKELQINADVIHYRLVYNFIDGTPRPGFVEEYDSAEQMAKDFESCDFQNLYGFALEVYANSAHYKKDWEFYDWDEEDEDAQEND